MGSHSGLRINPEHIDLKNLGMNRTIKFERFPKYDGIASRY